jgi:hypothetical protein
MDERDRIASAHECDAANDAEAVEAARKLCDPYEVEVWDQVRRVASLGKDGVPIQSMRWA